MADRAPSEQTRGRTFARIKSRSKKRGKKTPNKKPTTIALTPEVLQRPQSP